jgi:hypothetical protein
MGDRRRRGSTDRSRSRPRRDRSKSRGRQRSRERRGGDHDRRRRSRSRSRSVHEPVAEAAPKDEDEYVMTGGAGPTDTLHDGHRGSAPPADHPASPSKDRPSSSTKDYQTNWRDLTPERDDRGRESGRRAPTPHTSARKPSHERSRPRSQSSPPRGRRPPTRHHRGRNSSSRSPSHHRRRRHRKKSPAPDPRPGQVGASHSPTRKKNLGPDGTPFGQLPKYTAKPGLALGFRDHVRNTYKHIKAEHDAGHRQKGVLEKMLFEKGNKKPEVGAGSDGREKSREREEGTQRKRGGEWKPTAAEREAWERHEFRKGERDQAKSRDEGKHGDRKDKAHEAGRRDHEPRDKNVLRKPVPGGQEKEKRPITPEIRVESPTPPNRSQQAPTRTARGVRLHGLAHHSPTTPPPPVPEPPQWSVGAPPVPQPTTYRGEASPPRGPDARSAQDDSQNGAAASYYSQTTRPPMPGSYGQETQ